MGEIDNTFIQSDANEKIYTCFGSEFGELKGCLAIIICALYRLTTSAECFCTQFADLLRTMGFKSCRYDRDLWMISCPSDDAYDFI